MKNIFTYLLFFVGVFVLKAQEARLVIPANQSSYIYSIKITKDGKYKLVGSMDGIIKVFDIKKDKEVYKFLGHNGSFNNMDISSDDKYVLSTGYVNGNSEEENYSEFFLWEISTGKIISSLRWTYENAWALAISPDMKTCVLGSSTGTIAKVSFLDLKILEEYTYSTHGIEKIFYTENNLVHFIAPAPISEISDSTVNFGSIDLTDMELLDEDAFSFSSAYMKKVFRDNSESMYFGLIEPNQLRKFVKSDPIWEESLRIEMEDLVINDFTRIDENQIMIFAVNQKDRTGHLLKFDEKQEKIISDIEIQDYKFYQTYNNIFEKIPNNNNEILLYPFTGIMTYLKINTSDGGYELLNKGPYFWSAYFNDKGEIDLLNAMGFKKFNLKNNSVEDYTTESFFPDKSTSSSACSYSDYYTVKIPENGTTAFVNKKNNSVKSLKKIFGEITTIKDSVAVFTDWVGPKDEYVIGKINIENNTKSEIDTIRIADKDYYSFHNTAINEDKLLYVYKNIDTDQLDFVIRDFKEKTKKIFQLDFGIYHKNNKYFTFLDDIEVFRKHLFLMAGENVLIYSLETLQFEKVIELGFTGYEFHFIKDEKNPFLGVATKNNEILRIDVETLEIKTRFSKHQTWIHNVSRSLDERFILTSSSDNTNKIWDEQTGELLVTLSFIGKRDWVIYDEKTKLFDASSGAMNKIHYVVNKPDDEQEPWKTIEFSQLKHRYYQPNLLQIKLGLIDEKLRSTPKFDFIPLAPKISTKIKDSEIEAKITNQGGGIGKISFFINNSEIIEDLQVKEHKDKDEIILKINIEDYKKRLIEGKNEIKFVANNKEEWISSEPEIVIYNHLLTKGSHAVSTSKNQVVVPNYYALIVGTSDYSGNKIDLKYPSKDAIDIAFALENSAKNLFGKENVHIKVLHSEQKSKTLHPTKENIISFFKEKQNSINPNDIFVVYLAGHGLNYGGSEGDFYYLTQDASDMSDIYFKDPEMRKNVALSSNELTEYLNLIPALKKILILDACASGKAAEMMTSSRNIPASQVRALDRLQDRTGFYILAGSAADAVSYESSIYNQGILTYSLLKAMKGSALRIEGSEEYIDVQRLLNFAVDEVPVLASGIGGI